MTEPTVSPPGPAEDVAPRTAAIDGKVIAPVGTVDSTAAAGLELQVKNEKRKRKGGEK
jgi:hypothetical protein